MHIRFVYFHYHLLNDKRASDTNVPIGICKRHIYLSKMIILLSCRLEKSNFMNNLNGI